MGGNWRYSPLLLRAHNLEGIVPDTRRTAPYARTQRSKNSMSSSSGSS